jgi:hypothetical protein
MRGIERDLIIFESIDRSIEALRWAIWVINILTKNLYPVTRGSALGDLGD